MRSPWARAGLYLLCLLPLLIFRPLTPDNELKYLAIADEALRDGHLWCHYLDGAIYADKPPLYLWIVMGCRVLLGGHCAAVLELFSLLPALGILLLFGRWCQRYGGLSGRWIPRAEWAMWATAYFLGAAVVVRMDMLMTLFITLAFYTFWKILAGDGRPADRWLFGLYVFAAVFTKGPVGFLMPFVCLLVYAALTRSWHAFGQVWGWRTWLLLALLCGAWWFFAWREGGTAYLQELLGRQTFGRAVNAFHHKQPFYYYLYTLWYAAAPSVFVSAWVVIRTLCDRQRRNAINPLTRFFLIVFAVFFVMMSAFSAKLQIYLLPGFGFLTYAAFMLLAGRDAERVKPESC